MYLIWEAEVKNYSDQYIKSVKVYFATFDSEGNEITQDFSYANALAPGSVKFARSKATYYGTEKTAKAAILDY